MPKQLDPSLYAALSGGQPTSEMQPSAPVPPAPAGLGAGPQIPDMRDPQQAALAMALLNRPAPKQAMPTPTPAMPAQRGPASVGGIHMFDESIAKKARQ